MRKIRIIEHISLDGMIQAPGVPGEDGDCPYGGWTVPHAGPAVFLLGRRTYDIWSGHRPKCREKSAGGQPERGGEISRPGRRPRTGHRRGRSPHHGEGRAGPDRLGQLDTDTGAARTRAC